MELVTARAFTVQQSGPLKHRQVLGDGLPGWRDRVLAGQPGANLKERLAIPLHQLVEDGGPSRIGKCLQQRFHLPIKGKRTLACQESGYGMLHTS